ncbi:uncharacterized protein [Triticum aestivum]|uniref:Uncharacterized protein n=1 Tax=Aegilops tauschii subsp. strangulata TaxID=200361 RepID=A0A453G8N4_AEGTS|nr:uncharacterized protein LOC120976924 [Aegilops tauschii subsp. strangulata]XP_044353798.1 uncharacterized protein LOC123075201 [Triticum aestivum]
MKTAHTLLLAVAFLVLASEAVVKADNCAASLHKTPLPCDQVGCLHICREHVNGEGHACPQCSWSASCNYNGLCRCDVCLPPPSAPIQHQQSD